MIFVEKSDSLYRKTFDVVDFSVKTGEFSCQNWQIFF